MLYSVIVNSLNALYLVPMAEVSLAGTAAMVKKALVMLRGEPKPHIRPLGNSEYA